VVLNLSKNQRINCLRLRTPCAKQNIYYDDLIVGNILRKVVITAVKNGFQDHMKSGKLGGQNKIPRPDNRKIVDLLNLI
jgi:hypothetical protein